MRDALRGTGIDHIGFIVANLETAIAKWSDATGYTFSPIFRFRTDHWTDHSDANPHHHDARVSMSADGPPHIELLEFTGSGTHSARHGEGFHHIGLAANSSPEAQMRALEGLGMHIDGLAVSGSGNPHIWFTAPQDLFGARIEYVVAGPQPILRDDGHALDTDLNGHPCIWPRGYRLKPVKFTHP